jgi:hypothetical protein
VVSGREKTLNDCMQKEEISEQLTHLSQGVLAEVMSMKEEVKLNNLDASIVRCEQ